MRPRSRPPRAPRVRRATRARECLQCVPWFVLLEMPGRLELRPAGGAPDTQLSAPELRVRQLDDDRQHVGAGEGVRSEEHTSELQSRLHLVCRLLLEKKKQSRQHAHLVTMQSHHLLGEENDYTDLASLR